MSFHDPKSPLLTSRVVCVAFHVCQLSVPTITSRFDVFIRSVLSVVLLPLPPRYDFLRAPPSANSPGDWGQYREGPWPVYDPFAPDDSYKTNHNVRSVHVSSCAARHW